MRCASGMIEQASETKRRLLATASSASVGKVADIQNTLRRALTQSLFDVANLMTRVERVGQKRVDAQHLASQLNEVCLIGVVQSDQSQSGFVALEASVVNAIVQMQTIGYLPAPRGDHRKATLGEAALVSPVIDRIFQTSSERLPDDIPQFHFAHRLPDAKQLALGAGDQRFDVFDFTVFFDNDTQGRIILALPFAPESNPEHAEFDKSDDLHTYQLNLPVEMTAVIYNEIRHLGDVSGWRVGHEFVLGPEVLFNVSVKSAGGRTEFHAQLGQAEGNRALRLYLDDMPEVDDVMPMPLPPQIEVSKEDTKVPIEDGEDLSDLDFEDLEI